MKNEIWSYKINNNDNENNEMKNENDNNNKMIKYEIKIIEINEKKKRMIIFERIKKIIE